MKTLILSLSLLISLSAQAGWQSETNKILKEYKYACKSSKVSVDEIIKNGHIRGHITGLPVEAYSKFKVMFYVKTNRWYVHPYEGQDAGYSYSEISPSGEFKIKTVLRDVPSKYLSVVVVPKPHKLSSQYWRLNPFWFFNGVLKNKCTHTLLDGTGDFFIE